MQATGARHLTCEHGGVKENEENRDETRQGQDRQDSTRSKLRRCSARGDHIRSHRYTICECLPYATVRHTLQGASVKGSAGSPVGLLLMGTAFYAVGEDERKGY
jgi:hypothetical protein